MKTHDIQICKCKCQKYLISRRAFQLRRVHMVKGQLPFPAAGKTIILSSSSKDIAMSPIWSGDIDRFRKLLEALCDITCIS